MTTVDEKECLLNLPLKERTVALALKNIFDKIKQFEDEENVEVQKIHQSFIARFKEIEQNATKVINGSPIPPQYVENTHNFFTESEKKEVGQLSANNKGIAAYWLTTLLNFYKDDLSLPDKEIAASILEVSTNTAVDTFEVVFQLGASEWLEAGTITKRFVIEEGLVSRCEGGVSKWLKPKPEGILVAILSQVTDGSKAEINDNFALANDFITEIVPYSLEYFLGAHEGEDEEGEEEFEEQGDEEQEEQDEQEEGPAKKIKQ